MATLGKKIVLSIDLLQDPASVQSIKRHSHWFVNMNCQAVLVAFDKEFIGFCHFCHRPYFVVSTSLLILKLKISTSTAYYNPSCLNLKIMLFCNLTKYITDKEWKKNISHCSECQVSLLPHNGNNWWRPLQKVSTVRGRTANMHQWSCGTERPKQRWSEAVCDCILIGSVWLGQK